MQQRTSRLAYIDALRGIAAMLVLTQHFAGAIWKAVPDPDAAFWLKSLTLDWFDLGRFGVILFFLVSGFVIPFSFRGKSPVRTFAISRLFRLYPAYWLSIGAVALVALVGGQSVDWLTVAANLTMVQTALGFDHLSGVFWTLFIEMLFYVGCVILFVGKQLDKTPVLAVACVGLMLSTALPAAGKALLGLNLPVIYIGYHLSFLLMGSLFRKWLVDKSDGAFGAVLVVFALHALTLPVVTGLVGEETKFSDAMPIGAMAAALAAPLAFGAARLFNEKTVWTSLLALGAWSYSIYLFHVPVAHALKLLMPIDTLAHAAFFFIAATATSLAAAAAVYRYLEAPAIKLGQGLVRKQSKVPPTPPDNITAEVTH